MLLNSRGRPHRMGDCDQAADRSTTPLFGPFRRQQHRRSSRGAARHDQARYLRAYDSAANPGWSAANSRFSDSDSIRRRNVTIETTVAEFAASSFRQSAHPCLRTARSRQGFATRVLGQGATAVNGQR